MARLYKSIATQRYCRYENHRHFPAGEEKGFFDLYWCAKNIEPLEEIIKRLPAQYPAVAHDYHHILKSLVYFEDAESDPEPEINFDANWKKVKNFFY